MEQGEHELETEALPATEVAGLRAEIHAKISEALGLGVFTEDEARQWEAGFEACTEIEHMEGLVTIIADFIDAGLEVVHRIEVVLAEDALTETEKMRWRSEAEWISFHGKQLLLDKLSTIVSQVHRQRRELIRWLSASRHIASETARGLLSRFTETEFEQKERVIQNAVQLELKHTAEYRRLNQSARQRILQMIFAGELDTAERELGAALPWIITAHEYSQLRGELDAAKIEEARRVVQVA